MKRSRILLLVAALGMAGLGGACGGGGDDKAGTPAAQNGSQVGDRKDGDGTSAGSTVTLTAKEFAFDPKEIKAEAGKPTTIALKNTGAIEHDITIDNPPFNVKAVATKTEQAQLTIPAAGSYTFYCSVPGHRQAGMEGTVTVS